MTLNSVARYIALAPPDDYSEFRLRVGLTNLATERLLRHVSTFALQRRCTLLCELFEKEAIKDRSRLWSSLVGTLNELWAFDHYERSGDLSEYLDCRAVTIQSDAGGEAGTWWLKRPRQAPAKVVAAEFAKGNCAGKVGADRKSLWLTPFRGEIEILCAKARDPSLGEQQRNRLAARIRDKLGLKGAYTGEGLLAFITRKPIGKLGYEHGGRHYHKPVGPTVIEARQHLRFRPWPRPSGDDSYGRTYDLDPNIREAARPPRCHGAEEAVRPRMDIDDFDECIYIGEVTASAVEDDEGAFLTEIGAANDSITLLRQLAMMVS